MHRIQRRVLFYIVLLIFAGSACGRSNDASNRMTFDEVTYVTSFPQELQLKGEAVRDFDKPGATNFRLFDSLMVVSSNSGSGFWSFYELDGFRELGSFLLQGNGPDEFLFCPPLYQASVQKRQGNTFLIFKNQRRVGEIVEMNVGETLESGKASLRVVNDSILHTVFEFCLIDDSTVFCREVDFSRTRQERYLLSDGKKTEIAPLSVLNQAHVKRDEDINILSAILGYDPARQRIVEAPIMLNTLNLYSLDGTFTRSICYGKKADRIDDIQGKMRALRRDTFTCPRVYGKGFGVFYSDIPASMFGKSKKAPMLLFFDWDGNPLARLALDRHATSFDIDFRTGTLYAFDADDESMYRYDIQSVADLMD